MNFLCMSRVLAFLSALFVITGCTFPEAAATAGSQGDTMSAGNRSRHGSGSSGDLLYASTPNNWIYMFSYPDGTFVGEFNSPAVTVDGLCTDSAGNVFVMGWNGFGYVFKYVHGATSPSLTISEYAYRPYSCAVDTTTGDLAVFSYSNSDKDVVFIYPGGSGTPTSYTVPGTEARPYYCAYDSQGNLFVDIYTLKNTWGLTELPAGASEFTALTLSKKIRLGTLQWVSSYLATAFTDKIYHLAISGSTATIIGKTKALEAKPHPWIQDEETMIAPYGHASKKLGFWRYPKGGKALKVINQVDSHFAHINSIVVSVPSSH